MTDWRVVPPAPTDGSTNGASNGAASHGGGSTPLRTPERVAPATLAAPTPTTAASGAASPSESRTSPPAADLGPAPEPTGVTAEPESESAPPTRVGVGAWQVFGVVMTGIGILLLLFFVFLYGFTTLIGNRNQHQLASSLTGNPQSLYGLVEGRSLHEGGAVALLDIPALGLHQVVVMGTSATDLTRGPGLEPGTALPGEAGTAVIAGRRVTYGGPFGSLGRLEPGDVVRTVDGAGTFRYRVVSTKVVGGSTLVIGPTRADQLLLVTSDSSVLPGSKLLVQARLVGRPSPLSPQRSGVHAVRLTLGGDAGAGIVTLVWIVLFLAVAVATVWSTRRWGRVAVSYRLAVPILLACGLLACESLAQWLPATL